MMNEPRGVFLGLVIATSSGASPAPPAP
jgi:hypothetical protein